MPCLSYQEPRKELTVTRTFAEKHFTDNQQSGLRVA